MWQLDCRNTGWRNKQPCGCQAAWHAIWLRSEQAMFNEFPALEGGWQKCQYSIETMLKRPELVSETRFLISHWIFFKIQGQSQERADEGARAQRSYAAIAIPTAPQSVLQTLSPKMRKFIFMLRSPWEGGSSHQIWYLHRNQLAAG